MIFQYLDFSFEVLNFLFLQSFVFILFVTDLSEAENVLRLFFLIESLLVLKLPLFLVQDLFVGVDRLHHFSDFLSDLKDIFVPLGDSLRYVLPLLEEVVPLVVLVLKLLCSFIELDLG